jgi:Lhr-like helicase
VIVDEIHAIAGSKRGAHLALTLERLDRLGDDSPQRIGLSATQRPLDEIARFLVGQDTSRGADPTPRPCTIVDCGLVKRIELNVESPVDDLAHVGGTIWTSVTRRSSLRHMVRRAHDAHLRQQPRAGREDGGADQRAAGEESSVSWIAVSRAPADSSSR